MIRAWFRVAHRKDHSVCGILDNPSHTFKNARSNLSILTAYLCLCLRLSQDRIFRTILMMSTPMAALEGVEPPTIGLGNRCAVQLRHRANLGAGEGNRTLVKRLEISHSTIELHPHCFVYLLLQLLIIPSGAPFGTRIRNILVGNEAFYQLN